MKNLPHCKATLHMEGVSPESAPVVFEDACIHRYVEHHSDTEGFTLFVKEQDARYDSIHVHDMMGGKFALRLELPLDTRWTLTFIVKLDQMIRVNGYCDMLQFRVVTKEPTTWYGRLFYALNVWRFKERA